MLTIGLTGGIGSGKSTVARRLAQLGAHVADADAFAHEVVAPGTPGLAAVVERFGQGVLAPDGSLDRAALGGIVFADQRARADLEAITHPLVAARTADFFDRVPDGEVAVYDVPLLVEKHMGDQFHLVINVDAPSSVRIPRLEARGVPEAQARARMASQASREDRRRAADIWIENTGTEAELHAVVDALWRDRLLPYARNIAAGERVRRPETTTLVEYDPTWPDAATRIIERLSRALGDRAPEIEHIGSTAVPGMTAKDVIDLQIGVSDLRDADHPAFVDAMAALGFPRSEGNTFDHPKEGVDEPDEWVKRFHGSADPGRVVHVHVRQLGTVNWQYALLFRDWLRGDRAAFDDYLAEKQRLAEWTGSTSEYADAKEPWFAQVWPRMTEWARRTGWHD